MDDPRRTGPFTSVASLMRREPTLAESRLIEPAPRLGPSPRAAR